MSGGTRKLAAIIGAALAVAAGAAVVAFAADGGSKGFKPTGEQLSALVRRIYAAHGSLERDGVFLGAGGLGTAPGASCARVQLRNPTSPNIAYLKRRFGPSVCVDAEPDDEPICQGAALSTPPIPDGEIVVPDMTGVRFVDAQRRIGTVGLTWSACDGPPRAVPQQLGRFSITWLQVVTEQCPRAGQHVPAKTPIVLTTTAYLPGGYAIPGGALVSQCVNDRQAMSG